MAACQMEETLEESSPVDIAEGDKNCEEEKSHEHNPHNDGESQLDCYDDHEGPELHLEKCLEPRPTHAQEVLTPQDGSGSPKDVQKKLIRKVNLMSSNGNANKEDTVMATDDKPANCKHVADTPPSSSSSFLSIFKRKASLGAGSSRPSATSTTGLILEQRPNSLPAKSLAEQRKHQKQHEAIMAAAKKKEILKAEETVKMEERKILRDKKVDDAQKQWTEIIPKWDHLYTSKRVRELWWFGLPPGIRGTVWRKAIGNELNISQDLYMICLKRCNERLEQADNRGRSDSLRSLSREGSVEVIYLDVQRTFPTLGFFQEGGPYHSTLQDVLGAYACYRPDIGYVQGMSFIAAVLLLNMEAAESFVCLANLLNRPSYLAFFRMDHDQMIPYFETYDFFFKDNLSSLHSHFTRLNFKPEFYLIEWIFTIYTRVLPLDLACRIWDVFCRDGDIFLFRTALGILKMYSEHLLSLTSIEEVGHFLGHIPDTTDHEVLFHTINSVSIGEKKYKGLLSLHQGRRKT